MPENESPQARRKSQKTWLLSALILVWLVATLAEVEMALKAQGQGTADSCALAECAGGKRKAAVVAAWPRPAQRRLSARQ